MDHLEAVVLVVEVIRIVALNELCEQCRFAAPIDAARIKG